MDTNSTTAPTECAVWIVHDFVFDAWHRRDDVDVVATVTPWGLLAASAVLCLVGYYAMRFVLATCAFAVAAVGVIRIAHFGGQAMDCDTISMVVLLFGGVCALLAGLMMRTLSLAVGAASFCGVVGTCFSLCGDTCRAALWPGAPVLFALPLVQFWGAMVVSAGVGAVVARKHYRELTATVAAIAGGFGVAVATRALWHDAAHPGPFPSWVVLLVSMTCAACGLAIQYAVWRRRKKNRVRDDPKK